MELNNLKPAKGSTHSEKRIARGTGSGHGGTATRGHKGDKARSGHKNKRGHEGGQTPLQRRLPKFGFKNINRVEYVAVNLMTLQQVADAFSVSDITPEVLYQNGFIKKGDIIKVLAKGELTAKLTVSAHSVSTAAKAAIEAKGGTITVVA
jgi:large subunit ribosomal protein L15